MGSGWRRARSALGLRVCTSAQRDPDAVESAPSVPMLQGDSPKLQTPRLKCRTTPKAGGAPSATTASPRIQSSVSSPRLSSPRMCSQTQCSPRLQCKTSAVSPRVKNIESESTTSPRSPSRLALLKNSLRLSRSTCAMCLQTMKPGHGHAIFTAECSHAFHFPCIASNVKHGNLVCPICRAKWKELPSLASLRRDDKEKPTPTTPTSSSRRNAERQCEDSYTPRGTRQIGASEPVYDDDEPLEPTLRPNDRAVGTIQEEEEEEFEFKGFIVEPHGTAVVPVNESKTLQIKLEPEVSVLAASTAADNFTVLVQVKAPPAKKALKYKSTTLLADPSQRAPVDLVTVLDVSSSMSGTKLQMVKRAMRLVISSLGPCDRLSVVVFSAASKRVLPLRRMTPQGQKIARRVIDKLVCGDGTNTADALRKAAKILEDRRERNSVASIMLLSDAQDMSCCLAQRNRPPGSIRQSTRYGHIEIPVHSIGFGQTVNEEDAFAQSVGGLLSVVVQDVHLTISTLLSPGVEINDIHAGYSSSQRVLDNYATIRLGDLYAEEDREIVVELRLPAVRNPCVTNILRVQCSFKDPVTQEIVNHPRERILTIERPERVRGGQPKSVVSEEVEKRKNKVRTARAISDARALVERGDTERAQQVLYHAKTLLQLSPLSRPGDSLRSAVDAEITDIYNRCYLLEKERVINIKDRRRRPMNVINECDQQQQQQASMLDMVMRLQNDADEPLTPTSAWRAAEKLAKVAMMRKSLNRVTDLHGFENARF